MGSVGLEHIYIVGVFGNLGASVCLGLGALSESNCMLEGWSVSTGQCLRISVQVSWCQLNHIKRVVKIHVWDWGR